LDRSGQAVMIALPLQATPHMEDDKILRETSCDPKFRRVLVTDGKSAIGMAVIKALLDADVTTVFAGDPAVWKRSTAFNTLCEDDRVQGHDLSITGTHPVARIAPSSGGKVDILINPAAPVRDVGVLYSRDIGKARDA